LSVQYSNTFEGVLCATGCSVFRIHKENQAESAKISLIILANSHHIIIFCVQVLGLEMTHVEEFIQLCCGPAATYLVSPIGDTNDNYHYQKLLVNYILTTCTSQQEFEWTTSCNL